MGKWKERISKLLTAKILIGCGAVTVAGWGVWYTFTPWMAQAAEIFGGTYGPIFYILCLAPALLATVLLGLSVVSATTLASEIVATVEGAVAKILVGCAGSMVSGGLTWICLMLALTFSEP